MAVLASSDPARACRRFASASYLRHAYGGREACVRAQSPGSAARSLRSFRVVQEGGGGAAATVQAVPNGGPYSGHKVDVGLAYRSGRYVVASLHARVPVGP